MQSIYTLLILASVVLADDYATYPQVPKTASINGFADPIYASLPSCAKTCVKFNTNNTPCPYWDTGCFCVMPQWSGLVGQCIASSCSGSDVVSATSLATSLCASVGANTWMMPASISTELSDAAADVKMATVSGGSGSASAATTSASSSPSSTASASVASSTGATSSGSSSTASNTSSSGSSTSSSASTASGSSSTAGGAGLYAAGILSILVSSVFSVLL